jgi:hypothetical protein
MPSVKHGIKAGGEPGKKTDGYYQLKTGSVRTNAEPNGGYKKVKEVPAGPIRDKRKKIKVP